MRIDAHSVEPFDSFSLHSPWLPRSPPPCAYVAGCIDVCTSIRGVNERSGGAPAGASPGLHTSAFAAPHVKYHGSQHRGDWLAVRETVITRSAPSADSSGTPAPARHVLVLLSWANRSSWFSGRHVCRRVDVILEGDAPDMVPTGTVPVEELLAKARHAYITRFGHADSVHSVLGMPAKSVLHASTADAHSVQPSVAR